jgi:hypothetical protein
MPIAIETTTKHEEDEEIAVAHVVEDRRKPQEHAVAGRHRQEGDGDLGPGRMLQHLVDRREQHQHGADQHGDAPPTFADLENWAQADDAILEMLVARHHEREQHSGHEHQGERIEPSSAVRPEVADEGREAHMLAAPERNHRAQHREP